MTARPAKLASFAQAHHAKVALVSSVLLLAGLHLAHGAYAAIEQEPRTQEVSRWHEQAGFTYAVPVTRNATLWPLNTTLPMGQPAYYRTVSDHVLVNFSWRTVGLKEPEGMAQGALTLLVRSESRDGRVYWEIERSLAEGMTGNASDGLHLSARLDLDQLYEDLNRVNRELPSSDGRMNWTVRANVAYALRSGAASEADTPEYILPFTFSDPRLELPRPEAIRWEQPHVKTRAWTVAAPAGWPGVLASVRSSALVVLGSAGLAAAAYGARTDPARGMGRRDVEFRREHERFQEWVTTASGSLDPATLPHPLVDVASLEDLVAVAADARSRVLLDPATRIYYAVLPTLTYRYARHRNRSKAPRNDAPLPSPSR